MDRVKMLADPQPNFGFGFQKILKVPDMFHNEAFAGTPAAGCGNSGKRELKWYVEDWCGNLIAEHDGSGIPAGAIEGDFVDGKFYWFFD